ncbi:serine carboxypeptidase 1 isoform X2 [Amborella trichopoda]|uniref:serine carboxypeptidase 1 isoform X2 n=1 Tax=Amborella trichopoda TaxID=13333 RepID=UPI0009C19433|nr:serine carboxypeptidase 1 isoform X2 [Amborella trichopoda]|eukprot:XP_020520332.1 serine carboxypeptidase 1 isoform X2 [Amborella trichopoda]
MAPLTQVSSFFFFLTTAALLCFYFVMSAPDGAEVLHFPGFDGQLPSKHYAGYITLGNEGNRRYLYYYFATSERIPSKDPIVFWINGGPGCSGMNAIVYFHGPFKIEEDKDYLINGVKVKLNPFPWTKVSNIVAVDSPAGTGFSYADNNDDYETDDAKTVSDLYKFVLKVYSAGIEAGVKPNINFKGYSLGNELTDYDILYNSRVPFAHRMGLISDKLYEDLRISCQGSYWNSNEPDCLKNMEAYHKNTAGINIEHVLFPHCHYELGIHSSISYEEERLRMNYGCEENGYQIDCPGAIIGKAVRNANTYHRIRDIYCYDYENRPMVLFDSESSRRDLHAQPVEVAGRWKRCTDELKYRKEKISLIKHHLNLTLKGYRAFIYSGDHDMAAPYIGTLEWIKKLNYRELESWRPWFVGDQIAGYTVQYEHNLLFATFKGAGHTVAEFTPREALVAFKRWVDGDENL